MEQWEIDLRAKLETEIQDGLYDISSDNIRAFTGKQGYIEYLVAMQRQTIKFCDQMNNIAGSTVTIEVKGRKDCLTQELHRAEKEERYEDCIKIQKQIEELK